MNTEWQMLGPVGRTLSPQAVNATTSLSPFCDPVPTSEPPHRDEGGSRRYIESGSRGCARLLRGGSGDR